MSQESRPQQSQSGSHSHIRLLDSLDFDGDGDVDFDDIRAFSYSLWDNFTNFALRDNVLEVAVGLM